MAQLVAPHFQMLARISMWTVSVRILGRKARRPTSAALLILRAVPPRIHGLATMTPMAAARVFAKRRAMYRAKAGKATERAFEAGDPEDNFYFERADRFRMAA